MAEINNDVIPAEEEEMMMFERDSTDVGDQRINKGKGKVAGKNMLEPSDSENEKQSSSPHKPKVYVVSENSNNVVKV